MPLYFFDVYNNGRVSRDGTGHDLPDLESVRVEVMKSLPEIADDQIPKDGDQQSFVVVVRDAHGVEVYSATLDYAGRALP